MCIFAISLPRQDGILLPRETENAGARQTDSDARDRCHAADEWLHHVARVVVQRAEGGAQLPRTAGGGCPKLTPGRRPALAEHRASTVRLVGHVQRSQTELAYRERLSRESGPTESVLPHRGGACQSEHGGRPVVPTTPECSRDLRAW